MGDENVKYVLQGVVYSYQWVYGIDYISSVEQQCMRTHLTKLSSWIYIINAKRPMFIVSVYFLYRKFLFYGMHINDIFGGRIIDYEADACYITSAKPDKNALSAIVAQVDDSHNCRLHYSTSFETWHGKIIPGEDTYIMKLMLIDYIRPTLLTYQAASLYFFNEIEYLFCHKSFMNMDDRSDYGNMWVLMTANDAPLQTDINIPSCNQYHIRPRYFHDSGESTETSA